MNLVKCPSGHFYDAERYQSCPHCSAPGGRDNSVTTPMMRTPSSDAVTVALSPEPAPAPAAAPSAPVESALQQAVRAASQDAVNAPVEDGEKTVGFFSGSIGSEPVVGWLVCTEGAHFGEDFRLKSGRNFIGRSSSMDVAITKDASVSRERHAVVVYEPRGNLFLVQPAESRELCYKNGEVVLSATPLEAHDKLSIGNTQLMFIPCCTKDFSWSSKESSKNEEGI